MSINCDIEVLLVSFNKSTALKIFMFHVYVLNLHEYKQEKVVSFMLSLLPDIWPENIH